MTKVVIGTHPLHGTDFSIRTPEVLLALYRRDPDRYFDQFPLDEMGDWLFPAIATLKDGSRALVTAKRDMLRFRPLEENTPVEEETLGRELHEVAPGLFCQTPQGAFIASEAPSPLMFLKDDVGTRSDPYLIEVLESVGVANVTTRHGGAHLKIVEVPSTVDFELCRPDMGPMRVLSKPVYLD